MSLIDSIHLFNSHIGDAKKILITAHKNPDTDAIGSCLALAHYFSSELKKDIKIWIKESVKEFEFLPSKQFFENKFPKEFKFDTLIVCDCSSLERVNHVSFITDAQHDFTTINIDHHPDNTKFGDINVVSKISSVGELLYLMFTALDWKISSQIATCLYAAISFDTGRFAYSNVTDDTLLAASKLKQFGANPYEIYQALEENKTENDFQLIKLAIDNLVVLKEYSLAYTTIPKNSPRGSVKVIDFIRQLKNVELFIVFQELRSNLVKVNLRSKYNTNVTKIAGHFGGGGHNRAAGIVFESEITQCKLELIEHIKSEKNTL
jgi:bifunctional oligoribonuclease and PAP phosphatase NrnA